MPTPIDTFKKLTQFEQQQILNGYLDSVKDLLEDAIGSADIENWDETDACIEDLEACFAQANSLKDLILNGLQKDRVG